MLVKCQSGLILEKFISCLTHTSYVAEFELITNFFLTVLPYFAPFISIYILSRKISAKTTITSKSYLFVLGCVIAFLNEIFFVFIDLFYRSHSISEGLFEVLAFIIDLGFVFGMLLIYILLREIRGILTSDTDTNVIWKIMISLIAVSMPISLLFLHLNLTILDFLYTVTWPIAGFFLSMNCFETSDILRILRVRGWVLGAVGALLFVAIPFFSIYDRIGYFIEGVVLTRYSHLGEYAAMLGSLLLIIPGIELHRKTEIPEPEENERENLVMREFLNNLSEIVGGSASRSILEGAVSGFRERSKKDIVLQENMTVKLDKGWEDFFEFLLATAYQCVGPLTFECSRGIDELESASSKAMEVFGWTL